MRTARKQGEANVYHVVSRGVGQQIIFETDADRQRYLDTLFILAEELGGSVYAWCLMSNHVHLLLSMPIEDVSALLRRLNSGYAQYFNLAHARSGHLFQGRFDSEPVDTDEYLLTVVRYIHQNPWKAGMTKSCDYRWSSYGVYASGAVPIGSDFVLGMFDGVKSFIDFHQQMDEQDKCLDMRPLRRRVDDDRALQLAKALMGEDGLANLKAAPKAERDKALAMLKSEGLTLRQIARLTGISLGVISRA